MRKVTTINLNNNAYQIDEDGYEALRRYLDDAARALAGNPDREEILADLEQAIADKCRLTLGAHKSVVSAAEIDRILKEMGPVAGADDATSTAGATTSGAGTAATGSAGTWRTRRLYRIRDGQIWAGVCTGLAAYLGADVVWIRLAAILLTIFTGFFPGLIVYVSMVLIVPVAMTAEEHSVAHGQPFNAQELIDRIKKKHDDHRSAWRARRMNRHASYWSPPAAAAQPAPGYAARVTGGVMLPVLTILSAVWFSAMALVVYSIWWGYSHTAFELWPPGIFHGDADVPRWLAIVAVVALYALVAIPIAAGRRAALYYANGGRLHGWADAWSGLLWVAIVAVIFLAATYQLPELHDWLRTISGRSGNVFALDARWMPALPVDWWMNSDVPDCDDLVAALAARRGDLDAVTVMLAHQCTGDR